MSAAICDFQRQHVDHDLHFVVETVGKMRAQEGGRSGERVSVSSALGGITLEE